MIASVGFALTMPAPVSKLHFRERHNLHAGARTK
jgi:hypothetical protein